MTTRQISTLAFFVLLVAASGAQADDPPLRVGRISYLEGTVSFHTADESDWSYATLNYPVVSGNAFWTEPNGRSEVQIGSVEVRMDHLTEMQVTELDENATQLQVPQGAVNIHFSSVPVNGSVEVVTPAGPIELTRPGTYHIDSGEPSGSAPAGQVAVTALEGQIEIRGPRSLLEVMPGETAILSGNPPAFSLQEGNPTEFDNWALARERREEAHNSARYVSPHMTGYEDLDSYGQWSQTPAYGNVWYPTAVQADWAPYRYGHWAYVAPWGWTWVDNAAWGFAPFHYGRWAYVENRWGWIPGEVSERPVYAPALVAFVGGSGWNLSFSIGSAPAVGWVPLGPREVFHPYYPTSVNYVRNVNITNVNRTEINNITVNNNRTVNITNYVNQRAATAVPTGAFQNGQPVHKSFVPMSGEQMAHAPMAPMLSHIPPASAAREGRPVPQSARSPMPSPVAEANVRRVAENPAASTVNHLQPGVNAPLSPHAPTAPVVPHPSQLAHVGPGETTPRGTDMRPEQRHNVNDMQAGVASNREVPSAHAPGPQIHQADAGQHARPAARPTAAEPAALPSAQIPHPEQHTHIAPTPQGWNRQPYEPGNPPQQHHNQPHEPSHPPEGQQEHKHEEPPH